MPATQVIAIFDVGKTNKKLFLFNQDYQIVYEEAITLKETVDEDGDPSEDIESLNSFFSTSWKRVLQNTDFEIKAINFSAYGASFVHLDENGKAVTPLYNYLKAYPKDLLDRFYNTYGGQQHFSIITASPVLGNLNSGMQLYWLKYYKPAVYQKIRHSLHLPQYMSFLITGKYFSELTSIGCHTNLWDFSRQQYHEWVHKEGVFEKLAPVVPSTELSTPANGDGYVVGVGLHDSSAALIPYLATFPEPFVLISTGTWCISLNPFNETLLTYGELEHDCLCYLTFQGKPVKASRLFAGNEHEEQVKKLADHFNKPVDTFKTIPANIDIITDLQSRPSKLPQQKDIGKDPVVKEFAFSKRDLKDHLTYEEAYHQLIMDIVEQQVFSTQLVLNGADVSRIFVDGGFSKNPIYMHLLANAFKGKEVYAASMAQATSIGAALAIHSSWNTMKLPNNIIELKNFSVPGNAKIM